ncbi:E3 ubiquitin-protein ligase mib1-like 3, partial [Homarus americanus]
RISLVAQCTVFPPYYRSTTKFLTKRGSLLLLTGAKNRQCSSVCGVTAYIGVVEKVVVVQSALAGEVAGVSTALETGTVVDDVEDGRTALHNAANEGHLDVVKVLLYWKADINKRSRFVDDNHVLLKGSSWFTCSPEGFFGVQMSSLKGSSWFTCSPEGFFGVQMSSLKGSSWFTCSPEGFFGVQMSSLKGSSWFTCSPEGFFGVQMSSLKGSSWFTCSPEGFFSVQMSSLKGSSWFTCSPEGFFRVQMSSLKGSSWFTCSPEGFFRVQMSSLKGSSWFTCPPRRVPLGSHVLLEGFLWVHMSSFKVFGGNGAPPSWKNGHTEILELLLSSGAEKEALDDKGRRATHRAASRGQLESLEVLHRYGCDLNPRDNGKATPIHHAAFFGDFDLVKWLVEHGVYSAQGQERTPA